MDKDELVVQCPTCGADVVWCEKSKFRPFCCKRCKLIDLGAWLDNSRVIRGGSDDEIQQNHALPSIMQDYVDLHNQDEQE